MTYEWVIGHALLEMTEAQGEDSSHDKYGLTYKVGEKIRDEFRFSFKACAAN